MRRDQPLMREVACAFAHDALYMQPSWWHL